MRLSNSNSGNNNYAINKASWLAGWKPRKPEWDSIGGKVEKRGAGKLGEKKRRFHFVFFFRFYTQTHFTAEANLPGNPLTLLYGQRSGGGNGDIQLENDNFCIKTAHTHTHTPARGKTLTWAHHKYSYNCFSRYAANDDHVGWWWSHVVAKKEKVREKKTDQANSRKNKQRASVPHAHVTHKTAAHTQHTAQHSTTEHTCGYTKFMRCLIHEIISLAFSVPHSVLQLLSCFLTCYSVVQLLGCFLTCLLSCSVT